MASFVVDGQNSADGWRHLLHSSLVSLVSIGVMGISSVNAAPNPCPSLVAIRVPPISLAAFAALCSPKPWPPFFVVNPCEKMRVRYSAAIPTPLSAI